MKGLPPARPLPLRQTRLPVPRPDTLDPDLYLYLVLAHHVGGDPELHLALAQMVQTLAWCHGRPYPSTALSGTIDETGRHWISFSLWSAGVGGSKPPGPRLPPLPLSESGSVTSGLLAKVHEWPTMAVRFLPRQPNTCTRALRLHRLLLGGSSPEEEGFQALPIAASHTTGVALDRRFPAHVG